MCGWALPSWEVRVVREPSGARGGAWPAPAGGKAVGWTCFSEKGGCCGCVGLQAMVNEGMRVQR